MDAQIEREIDSDDEMDWEEIEVPERHIEITISTGQPSSSKAGSGSVKRGITYAERVLRIDCHKAHTIALLGNACVRNKWINDPLLHARLMSITPLALQNAFAMIHKSRIPDQNQRGRMFESAIKDLVDWWSGDYFDVLDEGHIRNRTFDDVQKRLVKGGYVPEFQPEDKGDEKKPLPDSKFKELDEEALKDLLDDDGERIRSPKSLMKHALNASGSRDTSAQLFTALCRALGIPARLIVSLQSVPWQSSIGKPKPTYAKKKKGKTNDKGKGKATTEDGDSEEDEDMEEVTIIPAPLDKGKGKAPLRVDDRSSTPVASSSKSEKAKGKEKAKPPAIKLRKSRQSAAPSPSSGTSTPRSTAAHNDIATSDPRVTPPVFWTEVFSRPDGRWLPVDPIRGFVNRRKVFDPTLSTTVAQPQAPGSIRYPHPHAPKKPNIVIPRGAPQDNRMVYVIALEEDGYGRDVTRRYAKEFSAKIAKVQGGNIGTGAGGKGRTIWWESVVQSITRPFRLNRDDVEDEELEIAQMIEGMPTTMAGFKDHPLYVLTRHLKQTETINPPPPATPEIGKFRGEPVYPRSSVVSLKTSENWIRSEGRAVREGSQPMKLVKIRAATVNKMRELEVLKDETRGAGGQEGDDTGEGSTSAAGEMMQSLYARSQTEPYVPDPVVDGIVPKNNFGNIDLYVPSMLPKGAVHLPYKGTVKIARKLMIDHAEAVVGFEFRKRRAIPIIEGVVIAQENEALLLDAYWATEQDAEEKARLKREDRVLKQWKRLVHGLRVRQRVQEEYGKPKVKKQEPQSPREKDLDHEAEEIAANDVQGADTLDASTGGGFLVEADDVVQAFRLPKPTLYDAGETLERKALRPTTLDLIEEETNPEDGQQRPRFDVTYELDPMDIDESGDVDGDLSSASFPEPIPTATTPPLRLVPKTMQEIAEAEERKRLEAENEIEVEEIADVTIGKSHASSTTPSNGVARGRRSMPKRNVRSSTANLKQGSKRGTPVGTKKSSVASGRSRTLRKRKRKGGSDDEEEINEEIASDDEDDEPDSPQATKRARKGKQTATSNNASSSTTPARTLRPRAAKIKANADEEKDLDDLLDQLE